MGYYTNYALEMDYEDTPEMHAAFDEVEPDYGPGFLQQLLDGEGDALKWYQHDKVMVAFSKRFPDVLFTLTGEGEESADIWKTHYKGGKIQVAFAEITIPEFNESKLKEYKDE